MTSSRVLAAVCAAMLAGPPAAIADTAAPVAAAELYAASCSACHGRTGRGVSVYPSLQNRTADYITEKLEIYRSGERIGPNSGLMIPNARDLTDAEIAALSEFISTTFR
ncbi:c-type cytochrome [Roseicyclus persicicus]|uniref:C-type cytochrome n=1 Tax=Roseicyclus persicicus TaxID=2650661 RepID=A0A7X6H1J5_9RHOB|nr:c-type cytochrome [Roseibacterium persicicum]NKX46323.1 c-type cytochrome [Roseibacterium persicicum]